MKTALTTQEKKSITSGKNSIDNAGSGSTIQ